MARQGTQTFETVNRESKNKVHARLATLHVFPPSPTYPVLAKDLAAPLDLGRHEFLDARHGCSIALLLLKLEPGVQQHLPLGLFAVLFHLGVALLKNLQGVKGEKDKKD
jgi:hypothetical protein